MSIGPTSRYARSLRRNASEAEKRLWPLLRNRRLGGFKFRRQASLGPYVVDFLCAEKRLIVEVDGGQLTPERDAKRTARLEAEGYGVIRFWNAEALGNTDAVLEAILRATEALPSRFTRKEPSPEGPSSKLR